MALKMELRIGMNNPSNPLTIYRHSESNNTENLVKELDLIVRGYYSLIDDCSSNKDWRIKIEEEVGSKIAYLMCNIDEAAHDEVMNFSPAFLRFDNDRHKFFK